MIEWRAIPGFDNYEASGDGRIRSIDRVVNTIRQGEPRALRFKGKELTPYESDGYLRVGIMNNRGKRCQMFVHRLVLLAFHGPPPSPDMEGSHGPDPDRQNNSIENLAWRTREENQLEMNTRNYSPLTYIALEAAANGDVFGNEPEQVIVDEVEDMPW